MFTLFYSNMMYRYLLTAVIVACAVVILAFIINRFLKSPAYRYHIWLYSLLVIVLLPLLMISAPKLKLPVFKAVSMDQTQTETVYKPTYRLNKAVQSVAGSSKKASPAASSRKNSNLHNKTAAFNNRSEHEIQGRAGQVANFADLPSLQNTSAVTGADIKHILFLIWEIVSIFLLLKMILGIFRLKKLYKKSCSFEFEGLSDQLENTEVRVSQQINSPMCFGFFRHVIMIPEQIVDTTTAEEMKMILMHELAHIKRKDFAVLIFQKTVRCFFFFNPFVWYADRQLTVEREKLCDNWVLKNVSAKKYAAMLANFAENALFSEHSPATALTEGGLILRVRHILDKYGNRTVRASKLFITVSILTVSSLLFLFGCIRLTVRQQEKANKTSTSSKVKQDAQKENTLTFAVVDTAGKPVEGATLTLLEDWDDFRTKIKTTDSKGECIFSLEEDTKEVNVRMSAEGYADKYFYWYGRRGNRNKFSFVKVKLEAGKLIGGIVTDSKGVPVSGARLHISLRMKNSSLRCGRNIALPTEYMGNKAIITDKNGKWSLRTYPDNLTDITFTRISSMNYAPAAARIEVINDQQAFKALRNLTYLTILNPGSPVSGSVVDEKGHSLSHVLISNSYYPKEYVYTDSDGHFRLAAAEKHSDTQIFAYKPGYAIVNRSYKADMDLKVIMIKGIELKGRVVDNQGKPIEGATVKSQYGWGLDIQKTDKSGTFAIKHFTPNTSMPYSIYKNRYWGCSNFPLSSASTPVEITLYPGTRITVHAKDAKTGRPPEEMSLDIEHSDGGTLPSGIKHGKYSTFISGQLHFSSYQDWQKRKQAVSVTVKAKGYKTEKYIRKFKIGEVRNINIVAKLKRAALTSGTVYGPDGNPLGGVKIRQTYRWYGYWLYTEKIEKYGLDESATISRSNGKYSLQIRNSENPVVFIHSQGFAVAGSDEIKKSSDVKLKAWASIKGRAYGYNRPFPFATVRYTNFVYEKGEMKKYYSVETKADKDGNFSLSHLPPGKCEISLNDSRRGYYCSSKMKTSLQSGEEKNINPGQNARVMTGRLIMDKKISGKITVEDVIRQAKIYITASKSMPDRIPENVKLPKNWKKRSLESQAGWYAWHIRSTQPFSSWNHEVYRAHILSDGRFEIEPSTPGVYHVECSINGSHATDFYVRIKDSDPDLVDTGEHKIKVINSLILFPADPQFQIGQIFASDGAPLANAQIYILPKNSSGWDSKVFPEVKKTQTDKVYTFYTDSTGNYRIPRPLNPEFCVAIADRSGFAVFKNGNEFFRRKNIILSKWGKIKGRIMIGRKPAVHKKVNLYAGSILNGYMVTETDSSGNFSFNYVLPGSVYLYYMIPTNNTSATGSPQKHIQVRSGETTTVQIGGTGYTVTGKIVMGDRGKVPEEIRKDVRVSITLLWPAKLPDKQDLPENWNSMPQKEKEDWFRGLQVVGDPQKTKICEEHNYIFNIPGRVNEADGSFEIYNVPPGKYEVKASCANPVNNNQVYIGRKEITLKNIEKGKYAEKPYNIGAVPIALSGNEADVPVLLKEEILDDSDEQK